MSHYVTLFFEGFGIGAIPALFFWLTIAACRAFFECIDITVD